jgi:pyruvate,water dikinase
MVEAVLTVRHSGFTEAALSYRRKVGVTAPPRIGVAVQRMVPSECAGVLFSRNPMTGDDERVIEASWGLGEAVVAGLVTPDHYRVARDGRVIERTAGNKDLAIRPVKGGGTAEEEVEPHLHAMLCLDDRRLARLHDLASQCEQFFGGQQDLEWAFVAEELYLLQRRAITTRPANR